MESYSNGHRILRRGTVYYLYYFDGSQGTTILHAVIMCVQNRCEGDERDQNGKR
jgi:hypothetical protein